MAAINLTMALLFTILVGVRGAGVDQCPANVTTLHELMTTHNAFTHCPSESPPNVQSESIPPNPPGDLGIVGGTDATPPPWIVSVHQDGVYRCLGTVLDKDHVLAPAQCVKGTDPSTLVIRYGLINMEEGHLTRSVSQYRVHPKWAGSKWRYDEAVLKVDNPVDFGEDIQPACVADEGSVFPTGTEATVYSWGNTNTEDLPSSRTLQGVSVKITDFDECNSTYPGMVKDGMVWCAGNMEGSQGACTGDLGSPLMIKQGDDWIQAGFVIRGPAECAAEGKPTVYWTPTKTFIQTAIEVMAEEACGQRRTSVVGRMENGTRDEPSWSDGLQALPHDWRWAAFIEGRTTRGTKYALQGAVLINRYFVATSWKRDSRSDVVVLGAHDIQSNSEEVQRIPIAEYFKHESGLMLGKLSRPVQFNQNVGTVCLPDADYDIDGDLKCMFTAWGPTPWLREASATIISNDQCRSEHPDPKFITDNILCTARSTTDPHWNADGSPLICEDYGGSWSLYGVIHEPGRGLLPTWSHKVSAMVHWINNILAEDHGRRYKPCFKRLNG